jgi:hypothetical protein
MSIAALRKFVTTPVAVPEKCGMCAVEIDEDHPHVVNLETRQLICACRPCYLLFGHAGAGRGKMRAVPDRYRRANAGIDDALWARLEIPVRTAFFFHNSILKKPVAFYPSPAGATESLLRLAEAADVMPILGSLEPDVEALLVHGPRPGRGEARTALPGEGTAGPSIVPFESFQVPINACYELVGKVRQHWKGFDGGEAAWTAIDGFFAALRSRCEGP